MSKTPLKSPPATLPNSPIGGNVAIAGSRSACIISSSSGGGGGGGSRENVKVVCRVRPPNAREAREGGVQCVKLPTTSSIEVTTEESGDAKFNFDRVFGQDSSQVSVFEYSALPLITDVLNGYNATIFAYGQTGTGKTHTMEGNIHSVELKGIIPRSVEALFKGVECEDEDVEFVFKVSYVEIYLEKIRDLLDNTRTKTNLNIREDKLKGIYIADVTEEYVTSHEELLAIMSAGAKNRATAATGMNEGSSRSHSVFTITVSQKHDVTNSIKSGKLVLVDLAGSEMVRKTNATGQQLEEAKMINKSLSALGQVINALTDEKQSHIPYRDSKLTRILQDSLGGNSKTVLIIAVSPSSFNAAETVSTCRFGMRAKSIQNKATVNQSRSTAELEILLGRAEETIAVLYSKIAAWEGGGSKEIREVSRNLETKNLDAAFAANTRSNLNPNNANPNSTIAVAAIENATKENEKDVNTSPLGSPEKVLESASGNFDNSGNVETQVSISEKAKEIVEASPNLITIDAEKVKMIEQKNKEKFQRQEALIDELSSKIRELETHLEEDANYFEENEKEVEELKLKISESEKLINEAAEMLVELQSRVEQSNERSEVLETSKRDIEEELESTKEQLSDQLANARYDLLESEMSVAHLKLENEQLRMDLSALSSNSSSYNHGGDTRIPGVFSSGDNSQSSSRHSGEGISKKEVDMELHKGQYNALVAEFAVDQEASDRIWALMETVVVQYESISDTAYIRVDALECNKSEMIKLLKHAEAEKSRIEGELSAVKLEGESAAQPLSSSKPLDEKERSNSKALQLRLEQLATGQKSLLYKFANLELELVDARKKLQARDRRIFELERDTEDRERRAFTLAERHVAELYNFRMQIQAIRGDHMEKVSAIDFNNNSESSSIFRRAADFGFGRAGAFKSVRGGGNRRKTLEESFNDSISNISNGINSIFSSSSSNTKTIENESSSDSGSGNSLANDISKHLRGLFSKKP